MRGVPRNVEFEKSPRKGKKYRVYFTLGGEEYVVDFGQLGYEHYKDSTPLKLYSRLNHGDKERRRLYIARATNIVDRQGRLTGDDPTSPNYWSIRYLW
jgi:hypothetical protein